MVSNALCEICGSFRIADNILTLQVSFLSMRQSTLLFTIVSTYNALDRYESTRSVACVFFLYVCSVVPRNTDIFYILPF
jgi:hypothetical protein